MPDIMHLQPAPGQRVLDPETLEFLPEQGGRVTNSKYWQRRLLDGSVQRVQPAAPAAPPSRTASPKEA